MNDETTQDTNVTPVDSEMSPEEAKASLGLSTRLSEQFLMQQVAQEQAMMGGTEGELPQDTPLDAPQAPQGEVEPEVEEKPVEEEKPQDEGKVSEEVASMKTDIELLKKLVLKSEEETS